MVKIFLIFGQKIHKKSHKTQTSAKNFACGAIKLFYVRKIYAFEKGYHKFYIAAKPIKTHWFTGNKQAAQPHSLVTGA